MWCPQCKHDVPILQASGNASPYCGRCGGKLWLSQENSPHKHSPQDESVAAAPVSRLEDPYWDGWRLEQELNDVEQLLETWRVDDPHLEEASSSAGSPLAPDAGAANRPAGTDETPSAPFANAQQADEAQQRAAWGMLLTGLGAGMAAAVQAAGAWIASQALPWAQIVLCVCLGQALVLIGLLLHLQAAQRRSRQVQPALTGIEQSLRFLTQTARQDVRRTSRFPKL